LVDHSLQQGDFLRHRALSQRHELTLELFQLLFHNPSTLSLSFPFPVHREGHCLGSCACAHLGDLSITETALAPSLFRAF